MSRESPNTQVEAEQSASRDGQLARIAHDRMREAILSGDLPAGQVFSQVDLAKKLDVGRTPLREALRNLQEEGLIFSQARRIRIAEFSIDDVEQVYVLRLLVETAAVGMTVPELTPEEIAELWGLLAQMAHYAAQHDFERVEIPHRAFHMVLVGKSGPRVARQTEQLYDYAERYRRSYLSMDSNSSFEVSTKEHEGLYQAVSERDTPEAIRRLAAHYHRTATSVIAELDEHHVPEHLDLAKRMADMHAECFGGD